MTGFMRQKLEGRIWSKDYARISYKNHLLVQCASTMVVKKWKSCTDRLQKCRIQVWCSAFELGARLQHGVHLHNI